MSDEDMGSRQPVPEGETTDQYQQGDSVPVPEEPTPENQTTQDVHEREAPGNTPPPPEPPQYAAPATAPPSAPVGTSSGATRGAAEKNKLVAGVLGILLGGLGIHKFYLGYTNEGIIMLAGNLLWIVGLGWIPNVLGLVEGVIYLFKSDQDFHDTYVVGTKKWL
jgi:TM2 domain-containing membrane protein YozV